MKTKRYWLASSTGTLKNALHKTIIVRNLLSVGWTLVAYKGYKNRVSGNKTLFIAQKFWTNLHPQCLGFLTDKVGPFQRLVHETMRS